MASLFGKRRLSSATGRNRGPMSSGRRRPSAAFSSSPSAAHWPAALTSCPARAGTGKTTIARLIAAKSRARGTSKKWTRAR